MMLKRDDYKKYYNTILIIIALGILTFAIMLSSPLNPLCKGVAGTDSSVFKYVATVMSEGGMPYRDTFDHKGPLLYIFNWIGNLISEYRGVWCVEFLSMFMFLFVTYITARLFCKELTSLFLIFVCIAPLYDYFEGGNLTEEYAMPFIATGIYIFIDYFINQKISRTRLIICGICFGSVCMLRINMITIWIVFSLAVLIKCVIKKNKDWISFLLWFFIGTAIIVLPQLVWLAINGSIPDFINDYIIFNIKYSTLQTDILLNRFNSISMFLQNSVTLVAIIITIYLISKQDENRYFNCVYLICFVIALLMTAISGRLYGHYGMALIPLLMYPYAKLYGNNSKEMISNKLVLNILMALLICTPIQGLAKNAVTQYQYYLNQENNIPDEQQKIVDIITANTTEDDKIIVLGNRDVYYLLSHRMAASKYSYQTQTDVDDSIKEEVIYDIETNCPPVVIMVGNYEEFFPNSENYENVYSFIKDEETTNVYIRKSEN